MIALNRAFAPPSHHTFTIKPIKELVERWVGDGKGWIDPYAGWNSPAEITNDLNPDAPTTYHLDALDFVRTAAPEGIDGVIFDPPYSYRQVTEHYKAVGRKATALDTSWNFYARVLDPLGAAIRPGGIAISCGWNSNGFGKKRGFELIEVLLVAHGLHHNDTITVVERKVLP